MTVPELKEYFSKKELPEAIQVDRGNRITDVKKFVESHFSVLENNPDSKASNPFHLRLIELKNILEG